MAKEEWGTKRTCPKCSTRFYDLKKDTPVTCIDCGTIWTPEPVLKTKQPIVIEDDEDDEDEDEDEEDLNIEDDSVVADESLDDDGSEVAAMVDTSLAKDEA